MAKYTTTLRSYMETVAGFTKGASLADVPMIIEAAMPVIFNFTYPISDQQHKIVLQKKILNHFYLREIGMETVGLWRFRLANKMNEIMPYYDLLYKSAAIDYNPLKNFDYTETSKGNENIKQTVTGDTDTTNNRDSVQKDNRDVVQTGEATGSTTANNDSMDAYSDTPQSGLSEVEALTYLTNARSIKTDDRTNTTQNTTTNGNENATSNVNENMTQKTSATTNNQNDTTRSNTIQRDGYQGVSPADMILKYRETIMNIDMMIINELEDLFMQIY